MSFLDKKFGIQTNGIDISRLIGKIISYFGISKGSYFCNSFGNNIYSIQSRTIVDYCDKDKFVGCPFTLGEFIAKLNEENLLTKEILEDIINGS